MIEDEGEERRSGFIAGIMCELDECGAENKWDPLCGACPYVILGEMREGDEGAAGSEVGRVVIIEIIVMVPRVAKVVGVNGVRTRADYVVLRKPGTEVEIELALVGRLCSEQNWTWSYNGPLFVF